MPHHSFMTSDSEKLRPVRYKTVDCGTLFESTSQYISSRRQLPGADHVERD